MKKAFTLVEIIVAAAVLTLVISVGYALFVNFSTSFTKGGWSLNAQNSLRNTLTFVREEMQKASYKTIITINKFEIDKDNYKFFISNSSLVGDAPDDNDKIKVTNGPVAKWFICRPSENNPPEFSCRLSLEGGKLVYTKRQTGGGSSEDGLAEHEISGRVLAENIDYVLLGLSPEAPQSEARLLKIKIKMSHPDKKKFAKTSITSETAAKIEVKIEKGV